MDFEYNGVPRTQDGPVLALLRSLPPITPLAVGAYGEFSRDVKRFITDLGTKGSGNPARFGCCHGAEQSKGVISNHASRFLGRVSLRGAARVRLMALQAVTSSPQANHERCHARDQAGNAWDQAGNRAHPPSPGFR